MCRFFCVLEIKRTIYCRLLEMLAPDINKGLRNDFREAMEQVDQDCLDDMLLQPQVICQRVAQ